MQIYIYRDQNELGPYSSAAALAALKRGDLSAQDFARTAEMSEYKTLREFLNGVETTAVQPAPVGIKAWRGTKPRAATVPRAVARPRVLPAPVKKGLRILPGVIAIAVVAAGLHVGFSPDAAGVRDYFASLIGTKSQTTARKETPAPVAPATPVAPELPKEEPKLPDLPIPAPEVVAEVQQPAGFNPAVVANNPALWPKAVRLIEDASFPAVLNGRLLGSVKVPAGSSVKLVRISGENLLLDYQGGKTILSWKKTNLEEAVAAAARLVAAQAPPGSTDPEPKSAIASVAPASSESSKYAGPNYGTSSVDTSSMPETVALERALRLADYKLTPEVQRSYLRLSKAKALRQITNSKTLLPGAFLDWIDSDPSVAATVYGARKDAAGILCVLRSLELDLGESVVRREYTQLALAFAVLEAPKGYGADLSPRKPLQLVIPGDPRKPVDTHPKDRPLDLNDHIINFLEDHEPVPCTPFRVPEFKETARGVAIAVPGKPQRVGADKKVKRGLVAADVIESRALQEEFNAYMAKHGQEVRIDCGDRAIAPHHNEMITGEYAGGIKKAYDLFRAAYEAKGRLPQSRDPSPTAAERLAFIIRNDSHFPASKDAHQNWGRFPVKSAPWPTMTLLAQANEPLREREEIWQRFVSRGEAISYGEYTGGIAQQADLQAARRLSPYPFTYSTFQMMMKDGGVCGTMANMGVRTHIALGNPASTAGQPGHCALIAFSKSRFFNCHGEQYATGGDDKTHPHARWYLCDTDAPRAMVWHQSVAYGVNANFPSYLDSMVALQIYKNLPESKQKEKGLGLLRSGLEANRYNIAIVEAAAGNSHFKSGLGELSAFLVKSLRDHGNTAACPSKGLYADTVQRLLGTMEAATE